MAADYEWLPWLMELCRGIQEHASSNEYTKEAQSSGQDSELSAISAA
jgi:hypothetical protein